jgi:pimeloyl-ACP methyl ester carboxylesterase
MAQLSGRYRLIAVNLYGYGGTEPWDGPADQTLSDQAMLLAGIMSEAEQPVSVVGHSFGGSVAMKAAALFPDRVDRLVLIEPNPFYLLRSAGRDDAFGEAMTLRDCIKENGRAGSWAAAAAVFADYWSGAGSWDAMPEDRRVKFANALMPNFHEWDAVMNETTTLDDWRRALPEDTTVISAADTVRSIAEIIDVLSVGCPGWRFEQLAEGGHMAALTHPDLMIPTLVRALS